VENEEQLDKVLTVRDRCPGLARIVVFDLKEVPGGTLLRISESGFDQIPLARRAKAFAANEGGWTKQMDLIAKYLAMAPSP